MAEGHQSSSFSRREFLKVSSAAAAAAAMGLAPLRLSAQGLPSVPGERSDCLDSAIEIVRSGTLGRVWHVRIQAGWDGDKESVHKWLDEEGPRILGAAIQASNPGALKAVWATGRDRPGLDAGMIGMVFEYDRYTVSVIFAGGRHPDGTAMFFHGSIGTLAWEGGGLQMFVEGAERAGLAAKLLDAARLRTQPSRIPASHAAVATAIALGHAALISGEIIVWDGQKGVTGLRAGIPEQVLLLRSGGHANADI